MTLPETTWGPINGPRALLLHGIVGSAATWWHVGEALASDGWRVTAVDLRGHGEAPRADSYAITDYVSDLPGTDWDLVMGHSLGGSIALVASRRPGFARRLALLDPVLEIPSELHDAIGQDQLDELTETLEHLRANRPLWHPLDLDYKIAASRQADRAAIEGTFTQNRPWAIDAVVAVSTLVIAAGTGSMFSALPGATVVTIDGAGHSPHRDKPDESLAALRSWLTSGGESQP
jgi:pimeloyl-ACP methyl ester carboxylesterase